MVHYTPSVGLADLGDCSAPGLFPEGVSMVFWVHEVHDQGKEQRQESLHLRLHSQHKVYMETMPGWKAKKGSRRNKKGRQESSGWNNEKALRNY